MVGSGGCEGWGHGVWCARFTCHLGILRLMTWGLVRRRRAGLSRWVSSRRACSQWPSWS